MSVALRPMFEFCTVTQTPNLSLDQIYPPICEDVNLNTCPCPDCQNFGVAYGAASSQSSAASGGVVSNSIAAGLGHYVLQGTNASDDRTSRAYEYELSPFDWRDGRHIECRSVRSGGLCGSRLELLSNEHFVAELNRLRDCNGVLDGPRCGACGARYLDSPGDFSLNGAHGKTPIKCDDPESPQKPRRVRMIHMPCKGRPGGRFSVTLDHYRQRTTAQNVNFLLSLVNGAGIQDLRRSIRPSKGGRQCGASRVYDRIFWLEKTLLAFEREQLRRWKVRRETEGSTFNHIAHDDVVIGINWETSSDRRLTQLNCSATADVKSGYVYRIDVDFDPTVDPAKLILEVHGDALEPRRNLNRSYSSGRTVFTHPLMSFQRPTGRLDEKHLFAAALHQHRLFLENSLPELQIADIEKSALSQLIDMRISLVETLRTGYFDFPDSDRDTRRNSFTGAMTRDIYTKAAHLALIRDMLPSGPVKLVSEQETALPRVVPHVFRELIERDDFTWLSIVFNKELTKPKREKLIGRYKQAFNFFVFGQILADPTRASEMTQSDFLREFITQRCTTAVNTDRHGNRSPITNTAYRQPWMPHLWVESPLETHGEPTKSVGFPLVRRTLRSALLGLPYHTPVSTLPLDIRQRMARHVLDATLQPVAAFFNSLRERLSGARRAGGRGARSGPAFVNGAFFNPRALIAILNIYRVYYNWFELRPYVSNRASDAATEEVGYRTSRVRVPGTNEWVERRNKTERRPIKRTPAMRAGIHRVDPVDSNPSPPDIHRVLYRPWILAGTPLWQKFEEPTVDRRTTRRRS